jgi:Zn-finger nucleic acid-binding protein
MTDDDIWMAMASGKEGSYFAEKEEEALKRLSARQASERKSPITGEPMTQEVLAGVVVDRCPTSGGIWLDAHELEQILDHVTNAESKSLSVSSLLHSLFTHSKRKES